VPEHAAFFNTQGRYGNRFQKWLGALEVPAISQQLPHRRGTFRLIPDVVTASDLSMKPVPRTGFINPES
jgi:hypothetical protein